MDIELFNIETEKKEIRELQLEYFNVDYLTKMMRYESPQLIEKLDQIRNICYFLNDMSLGFYNTISETKNIFTQNRELSKHKKLYIAFLNLHNLGQRYDPGLVDSSIDKLSPYMQSNS